MPIIVQKYGGTSVDGRERILDVAARVVDLKRRGYDVVVVVSAQGGTTNSLISEARKITERPSQRELDMLMTAGERISMSLLAIAVNALGHRAVSFTGSQVGIITDTKHTDARILEVRPQRLVNEIAKGNVVVVGGFQGVSVEKEVTTLGRGGSDTTAVALAAALGAERCEILTDVDAVYTADPRRVTGAKRIGEICYEDMAEMARFGATIIKEDAVALAEKHGIQIHVGSSSGNAAGTIILDEPSCDVGPVTGISHDSSVELLVADSDVLPDLQKALKQTGTRPELTVLSGSKVSLLLSGGRPRAAPISLAGVEARPAAVLCVAGPCAAAPEVASRAVSVLRGLGSAPIAMSSSGRSTVLVVDSEAGAACLTALHEEFFPADP